MWKFYGKRMKDWPNISEFCPCDLFSGVRTRMRSALKILLNDPQKFMRILKAGKVAYSGRGVKRNPKEFSNLLQSLKAEKFFKCQKDDKNWEQTSIDELSNLLVDSLSYSYEDDDVANVENTTANTIIASMSHATRNRKYSQSCLISLCRKHDDDETNDHHLQEESGQLSPSSLLGKLLSIHKINFLGKEDIRFHYKRVKQYLIDHQINIPNWALFANDLLQILSSLMESDTDVSLRQSFAIMINYLIASAARSFSIMTVLQRVKPGARLPSDAHVVTTSGGIRYLFRNTVVDLDGKAFDMVEDILNKTNESVETFKKLTSVSN